MICLHINRIKKIYTICCQYLSLAIQEVEIVQNMHGILISNIKQHQQIVFASTQYETKKIVI